MSRNTKPFYLILIVSVLIGVFLHGVIDRYKHKCNNYTDEEYSYILADSAYKSAVKNESFEKLRTRYHKIEDELQESENYFKYEMNDKDFTSYFRAVDYIKEATNITDKGKKKILYKKAQDEFDDLRKKHKKALKTLKEKNICINKSDIF